MLKNKRAPQSGNGHPPDTRHPPGTKDPPGTKPTHVLGDTLPSRRSLVCLCRTRSSSGRGQGAVGGRRASTHCSGAHAAEAPGRPRSVVTSKRVLRGLPGVARILRPSRADNQHERRPAACARSACRAPVQPGSGKGKRLSSPTEGPRTGRRQSTPHVPTSGPRSRRLPALPGCGRDLLPKNHGTSAGSWGSGDAVWGPGEGQGGQSRAGRPRTTAQSFRVP